MSMTNLEKTREALTQLEKLTSFLPRPIGEWINGAFALRYHARLIKAHSNK